MKLTLNKYKRVADFCYKLFKIARIPIHFSKFSNRKYTNYVHIFLLVYKQFRKFTYEELINDLLDNHSLRAYLGLHKLPHYTTLIKFAQRMPSISYDKIMLAFKPMLPSPKKVAIDATGMSLDNSSPHYCKRIGLKVKKRAFMKLSLLVDIEHYLILLFKIRKKPRHDVIDARPLIKKAAKHYHPEILYADRGYDDEQTFQLSFEKLNSYALILQKRLNVPVHRRKGEYRKRTFREFDYGEYLQRNKVETLMSMFKRRFGFNIRSRNVKCQKVETMARIIAFNIDRLIRLGENVILIVIKITRVSY
jgi:hypothetical protein